MHPNAPQPNFGTYKRIKITNIDVVSENPDFLPLKALQQLLVPDLLEANHPVSLIPVFDGDKYLVLAPTPKSKDLIKTLVIKEGETHILGRKNMHTGCLRNKSELSMALALSAAHIEVHFYSSENTTANQVKNVRIKRLGHTVIRLEDPSEDADSLESANLDHKFEEGILHPGCGIIHLYAGAENCMAYNLMTLSDYLGNSHADRTELLLSELRKYKCLLAEARSGSSSDDAARTRMLLGPVDEDGSMMVTRMTILPSLVQTLAIISRFWRVPVRTFMELIGLRHFKFCLASNTYMWCLFQPHRWKEK
eukprot:scaffold13565_cov33-Attheya_sp.AAC.1